MRQLLDSGEIDTVQFGIEHKAMMIREYMMSYFKGDCVQNLVPHDGSIVFSDLEPEFNMRYWYNRRTYTNEAPMKIMLRNQGDYVRLYTLRHAPDRIIEASHLDRSPQLRTIKKAIAEFVNEYIMNVKLKPSEKPYNGDEIDDTDMVKFTEPQLRPRVNTPSGNVYPTVGDTITIPNIQWTGTSTVSSGTRLEQHYIYRDYMAMMDIPYEEAEADE